jgi:GxxExxY protein
LGIEHTKSDEHIYRIIPAGWNELSSRVIRAAMEVHSVLGPGLLERLYEEALAHELKLAGIRFERQVPIRIKYKDLLLPEQRLDLIVEGWLVVELKAVERVPDVYLAQLVSYLRSGDFPLGLLLNFNVPLLKNGIYRRLNPQATAVRQLPMRPEVDPESVSEFSASSAPSEFHS